MQRAEDVLPEFGIHVQKTQITLLIRHAFACVSPPAVHSKALMPQCSITLTSGLDHPLASVRIAAKTEAYPAGGHTIWSYPMQKSLTASFLPGCMRHASSLHANDTKLKAEGAGSLLNAVTQLDCPNGAVYRKALFSRSKGDPSGRSGQLASIRSLPARFETAFTGSNAA
jgi:hypothetical protein